MLRPDLTLLDSEHLVAFALGVGVVAAVKSRPQALPQCVGNRLLVRTSTRAQAGDLPQSVVARPSLAVLHGEDRP